MRESEAQAMALSVAGHHFTVNFIKTLGAGVQTEKERNAFKKIEAFREQAEGCLNKVQQWTKSKIVFTFWVIISLGLTALATHLVLKVGSHPTVELHTAAPWFLFGVLILNFVVIIGVWAYAGTRFCQACRPGDTTRMVAKAWKKVRPMFVESKLINRLSWRIKWAHDEATDPELVREIKSWRVSGPELERTLKGTIETLVDEAARALREAELDGTNSDRCAARSQFALLDKVGQKMGFEPVRWEYRLSV